MVMEATLMRTLILQILDENGMDVTPHNLLQQGGVQPRFAMEGGAQSGLPGSQNCVHTLLAFPLTRKKVQLVGSDTTHGVSWSNNLTVSSALIEASYTLWKTAKRSRNHVLKYNA